MRKMLTLQGRLRESEKIEKRQRRLLKDNSDGKEVCYLYLLLNDRESSLSR